MTTTESVPLDPADRHWPDPWSCPAGKWWVCALLGALFVAMGIFVFYNLVLASIVSALMFGAAMAVAGGFQVVHAFSAKGWGGLALSLIIGLLFLAGGVLLMLNPLAASLGLTLAIAAMMIAGGIVRLVLAWRMWNEHGWLLLASGVLGVLTGIVVLIGWPWTGLWVLGLFLGLDLIMHGAWWLAFAFAMRSWARPSEAPQRPSQVAAS